MPAKHCPVVPAAVTPTALPALPNKIPLAVKVVAPVPPFPTGRVPVTSLAKSTLVPRVASKEPALLTRPVPVRSVRESPLIVNVSPVWMVKSPLSVVSPATLRVPPRELLPALTVKLFVPVTVVTPLRLTAPEPVAKLPELAD